MELRNICIIKKSKSKSNSEMDVYNENYHSRAKWRNSGADDVKTKTMIKAEDVQIYTAMARSSPVHLHAGLPLLLFIVVVVVVVASAASRAALFFLLSSKA